MNSLLIYFLLATIALSTVLADTDDNSFDYDMTSTCTTQDSGLCTEWKHSGKIKHGSNSGCFPENTYTITLNGLTQMKDLHIGDHLLSYDIYSGSTVFSEMPTWFHFVRNETLDYIVIETKYGSLTASPSHNIGFSSQFSKLEMFMHASDLNVDNNLIGFTYQSNSLETTNVQEHPVIGTFKVTKNGIYAPYTRLNNYFVSDDGVHFYLAHSYAVVNNPMVYEYAVGKTFDMLSRFVHVDETQNSFLNPIAKSLHSVFQLYENPTSVFSSFLRSRMLGSKSDDDERTRTSTGYNVLEFTDFLTLLAHTHATSANVNANTTTVRQNMTSI